MLAAHPVRPNGRPLSTASSRCSRATTWQSGWTRIARVKLGVEQAIPLTRAVAALHRLEVVHRDIKPDIVMLTGRRPKLIDVGVARLPRVEDFHGDEIPETPGLHGPEHFAGNARTR